MGGSQFVVDFQDADGSDKDRFGGKGAGLAEMTKLGLPVPPGFIITTEACLAYQRDGVPDGLWADVENAVKRLEARQGRRFGDPADPLLVSVRSGAAVSMPGMMDTVLNLGLNDETAAGLSTVAGSPGFAYDSLRRFVQMYSNVVLGVPHEPFDHALEAARAEHAVQRDIDLPPQALKDVAAGFRTIAREHADQEFPDDPMEQLRRAVVAVFDSWDNPRAQTYRRQEGIPDTLGTAVTVQTMVFGNRGEDSASGVAFTRNPSTGKRELYGEFLTNSQGEDVVAGIRTPKPIAELEALLPDAFSRFVDTTHKLEQHYRDVQDLEFTIEQGRLFMLQTRTGKRTAKAAVRIAVEMVDEGIIEKNEALARIMPNQLDQLLHRQLDPEAKVEELARGLPASPGAAVGHVVFTADEAQRVAATGTPVVLVRRETTPDDVHGFIAAEGILTARGGMTSHAAVVARGMGKPCVAGCEAVRIDQAAGVFRVGDRTVKAGDKITLDGSLGRVLLGQVPTVEPELDENFETLLSWADTTSRMLVRANADTPEDAAKARSLGARGIGLCRTEHMFMAPERLPIVREMILADSEAERETALAKLLPMQRGDFEGIFEAMDGLPVTIRLIDPPLHEFLPPHDELLKQLKESTDNAQRAQLQRMAAKADELAESNPMMGFRGCRLGILFPEIIRMQTRAILEAACRMHAKGVDAQAELMVPLVGHVRELAIVRQEILDEAEAVFAAEGGPVSFKVGTMIEIPRAALTADEVAQEAEFFSFGTNDLTQMTYGYSRDDAEGRFLFAYLDKGVLAANPFEKLDRAGVGKLVETAVRLGRQARPELKIGICGEHGGEPSSIEFCHMVGLDYVSCSPFRVPIARLAAAQAALAEQGTKIVDATM